MLTILAGLSYAGSPGFQALAQLNTRLPFTALQYSSEHSNCVEKKLNMISLFLILLFQGGYQLILFTTMKPICIYISRDTSSYLVIKLRALYMQGKSIILLIQKQFAVQFRMVLIHCINQARVAANSQTLLCADISL